MKSKRERQGMKNEKKRERGRVRKKGKERMRENGEN